MKQTPNSNAKPERKPAGKPKQASQQSTADNPKTVSHCQAYYRSFYEHNHLNLALSILLYLCMAFDGVICSWVLGRITDLIVSADLAALFRIMMVTVLYLLVSLLVNLSGSRVRARFVHKGLTQYKAYAFARLSQKSISAFTRENTGRYLSVLTNDISSIEENYLISSTTLPYYILTFLLSFFAMLYYSRILTLAVAVLTLLPALATLLMGNGLTARERQVSDRNEFFTARIKDLLSGFSVIKGFKAEVQARALFEADNQALERAKEEKRWYKALLTAVSTLAGVTMQFGIFLIGAFLAIRGDISVGTVIVFVNLCNFIIYPIQCIPESLASRRAARGLIEKLASLTEENAGRDGESIPPTLTDGIRLSHVTFGYEPGTPILQDLSCRFAAGKSYAIVGPSGSGKTTLINLLMGAFDGYTGSLTVDGKEMQGIAADSLYNLMSLVGQNVFLFDDTIRQNITMFRPFPDDQVQAAIEKAGLAPVIAARGEDYRCGENGVNLSGGERQRISIARSLLRGSSVLLADEATSSLDAETACHVTGSILALEGLTRIVITHSLDGSLLSRYDRILMLKNGRICEEGTFPELMELRGQFYSLYTIANP